MLVELRLMEQRYQAVLEVLIGLPVIEVARRYWGGPSDCSWVAASSCLRWSGRFGRSELEAADVQVG